MKSQWVRDGAPDAICHDCGRVGSIIVREEDESLWELCWKCGKEMGEVQS